MTAMENADERISPKSPIVCLLCLLKSVLWWKIAHGDDFCVSSVDQEEHPHAVRQRRRRRPRRSASQGGLTLWPLTWCEGAFVTAGTCLALRREGGAVMRGWNGVQHVQTPLSSPTSRGSKVRHDTNSQLFFCGAAKVSKKKKDFFS